MRHLVRLLHLVVTVWVAYFAPFLLLVGVVAYFPAYPKAAYAGTYLFIALGAAILGGTILGRSLESRKHVLILAIVLWLAAGFLATPSLLDPSSHTGANGDPVSPLLIALAPLTAALGLTIGLFVGARLMRPYPRNSEPPNESLERTRER